MIAIDERAEPPPSLWCVRVGAGATARGELFDDEGAAHRLGHELWVTRTLVRGPALLEEHHVRAE